MIEKKIRDAAIDECANLVEGFVYKGPRSGKEQIAEAIRKLKDCDSRPISQRSER